MWLSIDEKDNRPIYLQLMGQVKEQVRKGTLRPGDELPSVRELADSLGVNMHTVRAAYLKLRDQGIISLRLGRKAKVARLPEETRPSDLSGLQARFDELITDAMLMGLSIDDLRNLLDKQLKQLEKEV